MAIALVAGLRASAIESGDSGALVWDTGDHHVALLTAEGRTVWRFNYPASPAKPYFHPVALVGQPPLTWLAPPDHPWHLGLWFSWKHLNGVNYWEVDAKTERSEGLTRVRRVHPLTRPDHSARLEIDLTYESGREPTVVLRENRVIEISAPATDGSYSFDWTMTFTTGEQPVHLERTPIPGEPEGKPWGGYAGLIWRFTRELTDWQAVNAENATDESTHGQPAKACEFSGQLGGAPMGVAMIDHPVNVSSPTRWYVTMERPTPFACLMPAPLFAAARTVPAGETFTLRYRVIVHPGRWDAARLESEAERFGSSTR